VTQHDLEIPFQGSMQFGCYSTAPCCTWYWDQADL